MAAGAVSRDRITRRTKIILGIGSSPGQAGLPPSGELCPAPAWRRGTMKFGIDRLLSEPALRKPLSGKRVALLAHPASVTAELTHSLDALAALGDLQLTAAFGPQHGMRG